METINLESDRADLLDVVSNEHKLIFKRIDGTQQEFICFTEEL